VTCIRTIACFGGSGPYALLYSGYNTQMPVVRLQPRARGPVLNTYWLPHSSGQYIHHMAENFPATHGTRRRDSLEPRAESASRVGDRHGQGDCGTRGIYTVEMRTKDDRMQNPAQANFDHSTVGMQYHEIADLGCDGTNQSCGDRQEQPVCRG
jgi:hypothetical protein